VSDLFGQEPPVPTRYAPGTRVGTTEPWTAIDQMALWSVVLACQSESADLEARRWLCTQLGRTARLAGDHRKDSDYAKAEWSIINDRIVTRHLVGRKKWPEVVPVEELRDLLFTGARSGKPVTWGEYSSVLKPYLGNVNKQDRTPRPEVVRYLDRGPNDPFMGSSALPPTDRGSLVHSPGRPCRKANRNRLEKALQEFRRTDPENVVELRRRWATLNEVANS